MRNKESQGTAHSKPQIMPQTTTMTLWFVTLFWHRPAPPLWAGSRDALALRKQCRQLVVDLGIARRRCAGAGPAGRQPAPLLQQLLLHPMETFFTLPPEMQDTRSTGRKSRLMVMATVQLPILVMLSDAR